MRYLSIIEKLLILFDLLKESIFVVIFLGILLLLIILRIVKKISNKKFLLFVFISFILTFLAVFISNYKILSSTFDNFMDILFMNIYFPSIYVYLFIIISSYVIVIVSLVSNNISSICKKVNCFIFLVLNLILVLNLDIIAGSKVDIFSISLYANVDLVTMLELSSGLYILWLIIISAVYAINHITDAVMVRKNDSESSLSEVLEPICVSANTDELGYGEGISDGELVNPLVLTIDNDNIVGDNINDNNVVVSDIVNTNKFIDFSVIDEIHHNAIDDDNSGLTFNECVSFDNSNEPHIVLDDILNNTIPLITLDDTDDNYSLDDYRVFSSMLKEAIKINNKSYLSVNDILSLNLLNKFSYEEYSLFKKMLNSYTN